MKWWLILQQMNIWNMVCAFQFIVTNMQYTELHWDHGKKYHGWWDDSISGLYFSVYSCIPFRPLPVSARELITGNAV
jgi:hypothetical protein